MSGISIYGSYMDYVYYVGDYSVRIDKGCDNRIFYSRALLNTNSLNVFWKNFLIEILK